MKIEFLVDHEIRNAVETIHGRLTPLYAATRELAVRVDANLAAIAELRLELAELARHTHAAESLAHTAIN